MNDVEIWLQFGYGQEMCRIERQEMAKFVNVADRDQPCIVYLLSNDSSLTYKRLPRWINPRRLWK